MARINQEEYEVLKGLDDKWKWITRTELGSLKSFESKPCKNFDGSWKTKNNKAFGIYSSFANLFHFIQWEDSEPYNISELIEEHEKEIEETEVKSKQELIEKWESAIEAAEFYGKGKEERLISYMKDFVSDLNQLDETEPKNITREETQNDPVHSPSHYKQGHIETIDKIKLLLTPEEYLGYLKGNVLKYDRAPFKGNQEQDYDKQKVYYDWALEQMEGMQNEK